MERPEDLETAPEDAGRPTGSKSKLSPELQARVDAEAVALGRFLPLGMVAGAVVGIAAGWITHRFGICIPTGVALGLLISATVPVFRRRR